MSAMLFSNKEVLRGPTDMMMVTRLWRESGIRGMIDCWLRVHSGLGWDLASYRHMMSITSLTEFICLNCWKSKAHRVLLVLDPGL